MSTIETSLSVCPCRSAGGRSVVCVGRRRDGGRREGGRQAVGEPPLRLSFEAFDSARIWTDGRGPEGLENWYFNGTGKDKVQVEIVLGGHLDFSTSGSAQADRSGDGRTLFAEFLSGVTVSRLPAPVTFSTTDPDWFGQPNELPNGTVTEAKMTVGAWRFGDQPDGVANEGDVNEQTYLHDFDLRSMELGEIRRDVNISIALFIDTPDGSTNVRLYYDPAGVDRSKPGSDFATVQCVGVSADGSATAWEIYPECRYALLSDDLSTPDVDESVMPSFPRVYEGGEYGAPYLGNHWYFPFRATLILLP